MNLLLFLLLVCLLVELRFGVWVDLVLRLLFLNLRMMWFWFDVVGFDWSCDLGFLV